MQKITTVLSSHWISSRDYRALPSPLRKLYIPCLSLRILFSRWLSLSAKTPPADLTSEVWFYLIKPSTGVWWGLRKDVVGWLKQVAGPVEAVLVRDSYNLYCLCQALSDSFETYLFSRKSLRGIEAQNLGFSTNVKTGGWGDGDD